MSATLSKLAELRDLIMDLRNAETKYDHEKALRSALKHVTSLEHDAYGLSVELEEAKSNRGRVTVDQVIERLWDMWDEEDEEEDNETPHDDLLS